MSVYIGTVDSAPRNQFSMAIYTDNSGSPGTLVAQSANGTLTPNAWNSLAVTATLNPNTAYWLMYNSNGSNTAVNNMFLNSDPANVGAWAPRTFGSWPSGFGGSTLAGARYSIYASGP